MIRNLALATIAFFLSLAVGAPVIAALGENRSHALYEGSVTFTSEDVANSWVQEVRLGGGDMILLSLIPTFDRHGTLIGWDLRASLVDDCRNLLETPGPWHGLQPHMFVANDMVKGPGGSAYGAVREIPIRGFSLLVRAQVLTADLEPAAESAVFRRFTLAVTLTSTDKAASDHEKSTR
jgi:hypothetical protein